MNNSPYRQSLSIPQIDDVYQLNTHSILDVVESLIKIRDQAKKEGANIGYLEDAIKNLSNFAKEVSYHEKIQERLRYR